MTDKQYIEAKEMYLQGISLRQIGEQLNINRKVLSVRLRDDGVDTSRFISIKVIDKAIEMFGTKSTTAIANELNLDRQVLTRELKQRGYLTKKMKTNGGASKYDYNDSTSLSIVENYQSMSMSDLSYKYNISTNVIRNILSYHEIDTNKTYRKHRLDETAFDTIDSEEKAYWLGFLFADGSVTYGDRYVLELSLKYDDIQHIEKFRSFLNSEAGIKTRETSLNGKTYKSARIMIHSKKITNALIREGCIPNKSLVLRFPNDIPDNLIHHFMRGYFDGDGSIGVYNGQLKFSVLGTIEFLDSYIQHLNLHKNKYQPNGNAMSVAYGGNVLCGKIYDYLYKDATTYLERKQSKFTAVLERG